jgi:serine/threonine protein kinase
MVVSAGTRLGPYEILEPLGAGGMGEVYRARDPRLARDVAIKVLSEELRRDEGRLRRFEREARAAGGLNHPNILTIYDIGTHEDAPFVVSELLEGETVRQRMSGGALPFGEVVEYGVQIARGLAAAHEKGIVHRDVKPENLFLIRDGRVKILDFGLAKVAPAETPVDRSAETDTLSSRTAPGTVVAPSATCPPSRSGDKPSTTARTSSPSAWCCTRCWVAAIRSGPGPRRTRWPRS